MPSIVSEFLAELDYNTISPGPKQVFYYRIQKIAEQLNADSLPNRAAERDIAIAHLTSALVAAMACLD